VGQSKAVSVLSVSRTVDEVYKPEFARMGIE